MNFRHAVNELIDSAELVLKDHKEYIAEVGGCDHSVGICTCGIEQKAVRLEAAIVQMKAKVLQWRPNDPEIN